MIIIISPAAIVNSLYFCLPDIHPFANNDGVGFLFFVFLYIGETNPIGKCTSFSVLLSVQDVLHIKIF